MFRNQSRIYVQTVELTYAESAKEHNVKQAKIYITFTRYQQIKPQGNQWGIQNRKNVEQAGIKNYAVIRPRNNSGRKIGD